MQDSKITYSYVSKNVNSSDGFSYQHRFTCIFLKHSCINVDPDQNCISHRVKTVLIFLSADA